MKKKGMTLVVLVVSIIIIIIIASIVIMSLTKNNPIAAATEAKFKTTAKTYETSLTQTLIDKATETGKTSPNLNVTSEHIREYIPEMTEADTKNYEIQDGELTYIGKNEAERKYINSINILNGNPPKISKKDALVTMPGQSLNAAALMKNGNILIYASFSNQGFLKVYDKKYNFVKEKKMLDEAGSISSLAVLSNGNIVCTTYPYSDATATKLYVLDGETLEIKKEESLHISDTVMQIGTEIVELDDGTFVLMTERYRKSGDKWYVYSNNLWRLTSEGNVIYRDKTVTFKGGTWTAYAMTASHGKLYLAGHNATYYAAIVIVNVEDAEIDNSIKVGKISYGSEYRTVDVIDNNKKLLLYRVDCMSNNGYYDCQESIDIYNLKTDALESTQLIHNKLVLPDVLSTSFSGYKSSNYFSYALQELSDTNDGNNVSLMKISNTGVVRWNSEVGNDINGIIITLIQLDKNKYFAGVNNYDPLTGKFTGQIYELEP